MNTETKRAETVIEIITNHEYDMIMYFIYEKITDRQKRLVGVNYNMGSEDIDTDYMVADPELTEIYVNIYKHNLGLLKETVLLKAIEESRLNEQKKELETNFEWFLNEQVSNLNYKNESEREVIIDVVNMVLNRI